MCWKLFISIALALTFLKLATTQVSSRHSQTNRFTSHQLELIRKIRKLPSHLQQLIKFGSSSISLGRNWNVKTENASSAREDQVNVTNNVESSLQFLDKLLTSRRQPETSSVATTTFKNQKHNPNFIDETDLESSNVPYFTDDFDHTIEFSSRYLICSSVHSDHQSCEKFGLIADRSTGKATLRKEWSKNMRRKYTSSMLTNIAQYGIKIDPHHGIQTDHDARPDNYITTDVEEALNAIPNTATRKFVTKVFRNQQRSKGLDEIRNDINSKFFSKRTFR